MKYTLEILPSAERELAALPTKDRQRVDKQICALAGDPRPVGMKALKGHKSVYRIRAGKYRVIYQVRDELLIVLVVKVGHRRDVYRRF